MRQPPPDGCRADALEQYGLAAEVMAEVNADTSPVDDQAMKDLLDSLAKDDVDAPTAISNLPQAPLAKSRALQDLIESHAGEISVSPPLRLPPSSLIGRSPKNTNMLWTCHWSSRTSQGWSSSRTSQVRLCPSAGVFVSIYEQKFHLLLLHRCNRKSSLRGTGRRHGLPC